MSKYRVLYVHGLKGGSGSPKVKLLRDHPQLEVRCVKMFWPWLLLPYWLWRQALEIKRFKPDAVVGSSYGAALLGVLVQIGVWRGPCVFLSQALTRIFPHRAWIPAWGLPGVFVHGKRDTVIPIAQTRALVQTVNAATPQRLLEYDDDHGLRSVVDGSADSVEMRIGDQITVNPEGQPKRLDLIVKGMLDFDFNAGRRVNSPVGMFAATIMIVWVTGTTVAYWLYRGALLLAPMVIGMTA